MATASQINKHESISEENVELLRYYSSSPNVVDFELQDEPLYSKVEPSQASGLVSTYIPHWKLFAVLMLLVVSTVLLSLSWLLRPNVNSCFLNFNAWSPMIEAVDYYDKRIDYDPSSIYVAAPNPKVEMAWGDLWMYGSVGISDDKLAYLNKSTETDWHRLPAEQGGGIEAYFEVFHQLHCLDLVRQYSFRREYDYSDLPAWDRSPPMLLDHVQHCIETLRINLMCLGDAGMYAVRRDSNDEKDHIRYNSTQRCRRFDKLVGWTKTTLGHPYNATAEKIKHHNEYNHTHAEH